MLETSMAGNTLPYRLNVGIALFNRRGEVLMARRLGNDGPEIIMPGHEWQMPQGGIDPGEDPLEAARRELWEETCVTSAEYITEVPGWLTYDFPPYAGPPHKLLRFRGQQQKWIAMRFAGDDAEVDVTSDCGGGEPEFDRWRWEHLERIVALVVPFKRAVYQQVAEAFRHLSGGSA
jgi:putative (di)nucleoside polyphosphate hydrolase